MEARSLKGCATSDTLWDFPLLPFSQPNSSFNTSEEKILEICSRRFTGCVKSRSLFTMKNINIQYSVLFDNFFYRAIAAIR